METMRIYTYKFILGLYGLRECKTQKTRKFTLSEYVIYLLTFHSIHIFLEICDIPLIVVSTCGWTRERRYPQVDTPSLAAWCLVWGRSFQTQMEIMLASSMPSHLCSKEEESNRLLSPMIVVILSHLKVFLLW